MGSLDLSAIAIGVLPLFLFWAYFKERLSHIPGPPSASWVTGGALLPYLKLRSPLLGNLRQMFNENAWSFHAYLHKTFGGVVRVRSMFNVRLCLLYLVSADDDQ